MDEPKDIVVCSGEMHTVKDLVEVAFLAIGVEID